MDLAGGRPYRWLIKNIFPKLRYALTVSAQYVTVDEPVAREAANSEIPVKQPVFDGQVTAVESADTAEAVPGADAPTLSEPTPDVKPDTDTPWRRWALKTNLLYYAALMPNIEAEYLCSDRWSVALEANVAWYSRESAFKTYRIAFGSPEVRYWPIVRKQWNGMYVGAFAGGAFFDLENGGSGYQGPCAFTGLSIGYMWKIGRHLSLEAGLGAGYMRIHAKKYVPMDGHYVYMQTKNIDYFGPLKLKLSLVWHPSLKTARQNNR